MSSLLPPIILTDGLWRKSLSAIRSLGKAGYAVHVMGDQILTAGFWSRYTAWRHIAPLAQNDQLGFVSRLHALACLSPQRPVIFPMEDASLMTLSLWRNRFEQVADFLLSSHESLAIAQSKDRTMALADSIKISCPKTWRSQTFPEFLQQLEHSASFGDRVVKPTSGSGSSGILYDLNQTEDFWQQHWATFGPLLIQQRVPADGEALGVCLLFDKKNRCVASFAHKRLEQYPNSGGPSTDRIAVAEPELVAESRRLLEALHWVGVAMVEWKRDPNTGVPYLLEINPRFWGSLELAVRSGVDFPRMYAQIAQGKSVEPCHQAQIGTRCRWLLPGEILRYITQKPAKRESFWQFCQGLPQLAEEWDVQDLPGTLSALICTSLLGLNPKYWKYFRRG